eukprot:12222063-Heterocapsa_arctica.AAC.1
MRPPEDCDGNIASLGVDVRQPRRCLLHCPASVAWAACLIVVAELDRIQDPSWSRGGTGARGTLHSRCCMSPSCQRRSLRSRCC